MCSGHCAEAAAHLCAGAPVDAARRPALSRGEKRTTHCAHTPKSDCQASTPALVCLQGAQSPSQSLAALGLSHKLLGQPPVPLWVARPGRGLGLTGSCRITTPLAHTAHQTRHPTSVPEGQAQSRGTQWMGHSKAATTRIVPPLQPLEDKCWWQCAVCRAATGQADPDK